MLRSLRVADLVIKFLEAKRIKSVFLVPGGGAMFLNDALSQSKKIDFVANHHEQASVIAAEAYSRMTENIGVAMVTTGPGATNAVTGVAGAYIDSIPLLIISGQVKRSDMKLGTGLRQKGPQEVNIVEMISPITKYAKTIMKPSDVLKELNLAFNHATTGRKGPVWIDIPLDIQNSKVSYPNNLLIPSKKRESEPTKAQIRRVLSEIKKAERPLLLLGGGVRHASGKKQIKQLIDRLPFIVATTWSASDLISFSCYKNIGKHNRKY